MVVTVHQNRHCPSRCGGFALSLWHCGSTPSLRHAKHLVAFVVVECRSGRWLAMNEKKNGGE